MQPDDIAMHIKIAMLPMEGLRDQLLIFAKYGYHLNDIGWQPVGSSRELVTAKEIRGLLID